LQQRSAARPALADAEQILGGGVQISDQEILIEKDDAGVQGSKDIARRSAAASGIGRISV